MKYSLEKPVHASIGKEKYQCNIEWRNGKFIADEPVSSGGKDLGPDPYTLCCPQLASCALATLSMYIDRKNWDIPVIIVNANLYQETVDDKLTTVIDRDVIFGDTVPNEQKVRLTGNCQPLSDFQNIGK